MDSIIYKDDNTEFHGFDPGNETSFNIGKPILCFTTLTWKELCDLLDHTEHALKRLKSFM